MDGICKISNEFDSRETTLSLRTDIEGQLKVTNQVITDNRTVDLKEKVDIKDTISKLNTKTDLFRKMYDEFTHESTKWSEKDNQENFGKSMDVVITTKGKLEIAKDTKLSPEELQALKLEREQKRMFSFK